MFIDLLFHIIYCFLKIYEDKVYNYVKTNSRKIVFYIYMISIIISQILIIITIILSNKNYGLISYIEYFLDLDITDTELETKNL